MIPIGLLSGELADSPISSPITFSSLIHHSACPLLPLSFTPGLKPTCFTNPTPVVLLLPPGLPSRTIARTVSSELLVFFPIFRFCVVRYIRLAILSSFEHS